MNKVEFTIWIKQNPAILHYFLIKFRRMFITKCNSILTGNNRSSSDLIAETPKEEVTFSYIIINHNNRIHHWLAKANCCFFVYYQHDIIILEYLQSIKKEKTIFRLIL